MAPRNQLIGIIEIDADPSSDASSDDSFEAALRQLRCEGLTLEGEPLCSTGSFCYWEEELELGCGDVAVMSADLHQLHTDLENELAQFIDRLLATR